MRNRVLLSAGAIALLAASCAQPEPQVLSEAPRSATTAELTAPSKTADEEAQPGRFIARCATEADGGTPGMTYFTDGSQNVTDLCLSRYYIGVQPAPGALYVPDEDAGSLAPTRESTTETSGSTPRWTPAQPRTDEDAQGIPDQGLDRPDDESSTTETEEPGTDETGTGETESPTPGETTPTSPPTTPTDPTDPGTSEPGTDESGSETPDETEPPAPRSRAPRPRCPPPRQARRRRAGPRRPPPRHRSTRADHSVHPARTTRLRRTPCRRPEARGGPDRPSSRRVRTPDSRPADSVTTSFHLGRAASGRLRPRSCDDVGPHASRGDRRRPQRCRS